MFDIGTVDESVIAIKGYITDLGRSGRTMSLFGVAHEGLRKEIADWLRVIRPDQARPIGNWLVCILWLANKDGDGRVEKMIDVFEAHFKVHTKFSTDEVQLYIKSGETAGK